MELCVLSRDQEYIIGDLIGDLYLQFNELLTLYVLMIRFY
jgi:hypothetical protein